MKALPRWVYTQQNAICGRVLHPLKDHAAQEALTGAQCPPMTPWHQTINQPANPATYTTILVDPWHCHLLSGQIDKFDTVRAGCGQDLRMCLLCGSLLQRNALVMTDQQAINLQSIASACIPIMRVVPCTACSVHTLCTSHTSHTEHGSSQLLKQSAAYQKTHPPNMHPCMHHHCNCGGITTAHKHDIMQNTPETPQYQQPLAVATIICSPSSCCQCCAAPPAK